MKKQRVKHPYRKDWTCVILKQKCGCPCHYTPGILHSFSCCHMGYIEVIADEKPNK